MHITPLLLIALFPLALAAHTTPPRHRRLTPRTPLAPLKRAGAPYSNATIQSMSEVAAAYSASISAEDADQAQTTSAAATATAADITASTTDDTGAVVTAPVTSDTAVSIAASTVVSPSAAVSSAVVVSSAAPVIITQPSTLVTSSTTPSVTPSTTLDITSPATSSTEQAPTTVLASTLIITHSSLPSVTTAIKTALASSSASSAADKSKSTTSGLSKTALVAIIAVASVVGLAAAGFTAFRKWKLKPSGRFDSRMKPIDFSPHNDGMDDFMEKTLHRPSADLQRKQYASELDTSGVPEHDFTATTNIAGQGAYDMNMYNSDPYAHAEAYDYDAQYQYDQGGQGHQYPPGNAGGVDYPTHDTGVNGYEEHGQGQGQGGYADLQRGNSIGSGSGHGHGSGMRGIAPQIYPGDFPMAENYLGRPTGGSDGPYAQAAQYRSY